MATKKVINFANRNPVKVSKWIVETGQTVYPGRALLFYEVDDSGLLSKLKSKCVGRVVSLIAKEGEMLNPGDPVLEVEEGCSHPTVMNDLCAECGADLQREGVESNATVPMIHHLPQLKVSQQEAEMIGKADTARLLKDRKLVLLVDLDQTLIHTTHDNIPNNIKDVHHFQLGTSAWYHTRLRPNTAHFLKEMSAYFELHICTFGVRPYAHMVANILDRDQSLFSNRILSRDEFFDFNSKVANLQALFPNGDELVCIIDDRKDVWNFSPNLIPVKPYVFFTNTGDINDPNLPPINKHSDFFAKGVKVKKREGNISTGAAGEDMESKDSVASVEEEFEVEDEDDYLLYLETILKKVHKLFYQVYDKEIEGQPHVRWVLDQLKGNVLKGCEIVFSGLVPLHEGLEKSEPYLMATDLGAQIGKNVSESTTHIVAAREGTAKLHESKKFSKIKIVNPHWLTTCLYRWEHVDERLFPLIRNKNSDKKEKDSVPLALSFDDVVSMQQEVQAEFNSDSSDTDGLKKKTVSCPIPENNEVTLVKSANLPENPVRNLPVVDKPLQTILKKTNSNKVGPSKRSNDDINDEKSVKVKDLKIGKEVHDSVDCNIKKKEMDKISSLLGVLNRKRPRPVELDFLKNNNTGSLKSFQIPKKVTIIDEPQVRIIENNKQEATVKLSKNKRKKLNKLMNRNNSPPSPSSKASTSSNNGNEQSKKSMLKESKVLSSQLLEQHLLKKQYLNNELKHQVDLMRYHYEEHRLKVEQGMAEHSLRIHLMNREHENKMKLMNKLNMVKIQSLLNGCNRILTNGFKNDTEHSDVENLDNLDISFGDSMDEEMDK